MTVFSGEEEAYRDSMSGSCVDCGGEPFVRGRSGASSRLGSGSTTRDGLGGVLFPTGRETALLVFSGFVLFVGLTRDGRVMGGVDWRREGCIERAIGLAGAAGRVGAEAVG